jgi:site-specific recombinase XerD
VLRVAYAWGLRRREVSRLEVHDWGRNPRAAEFGELGALSVRWAKALAGGPPRRRTVLTVFDWAVENVEEYLSEIRPLYDFEGLAAMWPTERGGATADVNIGKMFATIRDEAGLPRELGPHCLRHSYVTHLIEDGFEPLFVQQQVGHAWASTTALYTSVASDFKNQALRQVLDRRLDRTAEGSS